MADELPANVDLNWIARTLLAMRTEMRGLEGKVDTGFARLERLQAEDRALLEDVAREVGLEPTAARLRREKFEAETRQRLDRIEAKVFPAE